MFAVPTDFDKGAAMRLLFDIGATNTRLGISKDGAMAGEKSIFPTLPGFSEGIKELARQARELTQGKDIEMAVGGIAGPLDREKKEIISPGNIPGWHRKPIRVALQKAFGAPVYLENDVALVGLGEAAYGAGRGHDIVVYATFSSGFGATRVVGERIDVSRFGFEPAFQIVGYSSGDTTFEPHHYLRFHVSGARLRAKYGSGPTEISDPKTWDEIARWMAVGLNNVIVFWSPDCLVLGGPLLRRASFERVTRYVRNAVFVFPELPKMKEAELGDYGGLYGALRLSNLQLR